MKRTLLALAIFAVAAFPAHARPAYKNALAHYFGNHLPKNLHACTTCHVPDPSGQKTGLDADKPHNVFGLRLKAVKSVLLKAGKATTIDARLDAILNEDSDGDGVSNLLEILSGHAPGDKADRPSERELTAAKSKLAAFLRERAGYPWRPFEVVKRPIVPSVKNSAWVRNPIDAFIAAEHEARGLKPRPEAAREVLLRRVYLDLIGLPPTPAELHAFLKECDVATPQAAYEKVVDDLLNRPQYGERWGRHWMDVWRYSDWAGYGKQVRDSQPHIWHWRDWIIDSLNADKGYDRMILEMLAGDELAPDDPRALAGTGYLVRNFKLLSREKWMQDTVEHTFLAFQGVTIQCAKCHDHMFDPILQTEYYQLRAIFEPHNVRTDRLPGETDIKKDGLPRAYDKDLTAVTQLFIRGDDRFPDKTKKIVPGVPEVLGGRFPKIEPIKLKSVPPPLDKKTPSYPKESTGRRLALAKWLADADNPLTARVAVNHLWLRHFGQAIVPTVFDFGRNGRPPSHPALLDWLAAEFMAPFSRLPKASAEPALAFGKRLNGAWSMKHLHRLIVTSATYRQASTPDAANLRLDPDNQYLWRYAPHRLEAEVVRDGVFHVAGKLDLTRGGPDIDYKLGLTTPRRSLYFRHAAEKQMEFLQLFDAASVTECYERRHAIVPQQALALMNSAVALKHARILARNIKTADAEAFVVAAFEHVLSRRPNAAEAKECADFLTQETRRLQSAKPAGGKVADGSQPSNDPAQRARENLVHALMNHHEFVTLR